MIRQGKAYVDDTEPETMKLERDQKLESKNRSNSNIFSFKKMFKIFYEISFRYRRREEHVSVGRNEQRHRFGSKVLCTSQNRYAIRQRLHAWSYYVSMQERAARPHWLQVQVRSSIDYTLLNV